MKLGSLEAVSQRAGSGYDRYYSEKCQAVVENLWEQALFYNHSKTDNMMDLKQTLVPACHFNHTNAHEVCLMCGFNWTATLRLNPTTFLPLCLRALKAMTRWVLTTPGTAAPEWGGSALWTPAGCSWPRPACCLTSTGGGGLSPSQCWHLKTGSLREFWRQALTWSQGLSLSGEKNRESLEVRHDV